MPFIKPPFQALTLKAKGRLDRLITEVEISEAFDPASPPTPLPMRAKALALWDTGASKSVISAEFAKTLGLTPTGVREVHHGGGVSIENTFVVNFYLPNGVGVVGVTATEFKASHTQFSALIGMDVIGLGDFAVTNVNGQTWMSFRVPAHHAIDYVLEADKIACSRMNRNEPCFCGKKTDAGAPIKFKHCHGK
jgi:hypothetical protein